MTDCFISYAKEDVEFAHQLFEDLVKSGVDAWMDKPPKGYSDVGLAPGESWEHRLREVISESRFFIALFSTNSVNKSGFVQSEYRQALKRLSQIPLSRVFVIPVKLDDCPLPAYDVDGVSFGQYQWTECYDGVFDDLVAFIKKSLVRERQTQSASGGLEVESAESLLNSIVDEANIVVRKDLILTAAANVENRNVIIEDVFDGIEHKVMGVRNLAISSKNKSTIEVLPRYANVLKFSACRSVNIENLILGHTKDAGSCRGGVLRLEGCHDFKVSDCDLFGCGTFSFEIFQSSNITFERCRFYGCSYGMFEIFDSEDVKVKECLCFNNHCFDGATISNSDLKMIDSTFRFNSRVSSSYLEESPMFKVINSKVTAENCKFENNKFKMFGDVELINPVRSDFYENDWDE